MPYVTQIVSQVDTVMKFYNKATGEKLDYLEDWHPRALFEPLEVTRIKILKEFCMKPPENETEQAAEMLGQWLKANDAHCDIAVYGDGSGHNRITGMGSLTQYKIIKRIFPRAMARVELHLRIGAQMPCNPAQQALVRRLFLDRVIQVIAADAAIGLKRRCRLHDVDDARMSATDDERRRLLANQ